MIVGLIVKAWGIFSPGFLVNADCIAGQYPALKK